MNPQVILDWADNLVAIDPTTIRPAAQDSACYHGHGNPCQMIWIAVELAGISHQDGRQLIASFFGLSDLKSLKHLTIAQLMAVYRFRDTLGELYVQSISGVHSARTGSLTTG